MQNFEFSEEKKDSCRRFINLIDMLYENKCSIVILASRPINYLNNIKIKLWQAWMTSHMQSFMLHVELQNFLNVAASPMKNPQSSARKI